jgi:hypothetical protein
MGSWPWPQLNLWFGIAAALAGLYVTAPEAAPISWGYLRAIWRWFRRVALTVLRRRRSAPPAGESHGGFNLNGSGLGDGHAHLSETGMPGGVDQQIEELRRAVRALQARLDDHDRKLREERGERTEADERIETSVEREVDRIDSETATRERQSAVVNARGLLPVALGIVLSGAPNELAPLWELSLLLLLLAVVGTTALVVVTIRAQWTEYRARARRSQAPPPAAAA